MRIVHLALGGCLRAPPVSYGLTADTGGHIAYVLAAAEAQGRLEEANDVTIVTRLFQDARVGEAYAVEIEQLAPGVRIVRLPTRRPDYLEKEALAAELPSFTARFLEWLSRECQVPSVIQAHFADAATVALAARDRYGIPFAYTPHALGLDKIARCGGLPSSREAAEASAIESADAILVSSRDEAERQIAGYMIDGSGARTHIVPPGVPVAGGGDRLVGDPEHLFSKPDRPLVLAIARPTVKKNLVGVARAFAGSRLRETCNLLVLAGQHDVGVEDAEQRIVLSQLRTVLETSMAERRAALPRCHSTADVRALMRCAAASGGVFVSPALHEPFGLTLLEAAAANLPVVATRHGGAADIVRAVGHGLIVEPGDHRAVATACLRVVEDGDLRGSLVDACASHADVFCWDRFARRSVAIYADAIRSAARRDSVAA